MIDCGHAAPSARPGYVLCGALKGMGTGPRTLVLQRAVCARCSRREDDKALCRIAVRMWARELAVPGRELECLRKISELAGRAALAQRTSDWDKDPNAWRDEKGRFMEPGEWAARAGKSAAQRALVEAVRNGMDAGRAERVARELWPEDA